MHAKISAKPLKCHISAQEGRTGLTKKPKCVPKYGKGPFIPFFMSYDLGIHSYWRKNWFLGRDKDSRQTKIPIFMLFWTFFWA